MRTEDGCIIRECLNGEPEAFGVLVDKYKEGIYAFVYAKLRDFQDAQDVTQEVFLQAYRGLRSLRRWESFSFWLYRIAYARCSQWFRVRSKRVDREFIDDQPPEAIVASSLDSYRKNQLIESVRDALDSLPETYREVLMLYYFGGMNSVDIANALGTSPTAIRHRLSRARAQLREEMVAMMGTAFERQKLRAGFTFRIIESIKHIKIHPASQPRGLPWGISLATGLLATVLSLGHYPIAFNTPEVPAGSSLPGESKLMGAGEMPVDVLRSSVFSQHGSGDGAGEHGSMPLQNALFMAPQGQYTTGGQDNRQNGVSLAPGGQDYTFVRSWPEEILGLRHPFDVAVDSSGNVYVADTHNHRIQKFDSNSEPLMKWGTYGSGDGQFIRPINITIDSVGSIYVTDRENYRVQKFDPEGRFLMKWATEGSSWGVAVDGSGNVYAANIDNDRIQKFDPNGDLLMKWGSEGSGDGQFKWPRGIALDGTGNVYVVDSFNHRIQKFNSNGSFLIEWGTYGSGNGQFHLPHNIATDKAGNVYVADYYNQRIQKFDSNGNFLMKWGSTGCSDGRFQFPAGIVIDSVGDIYVTDTQNNRVQKFDSNGRFLMKLGTEGSADGQLQCPIDIAVDNSGNVYVVELESHRVQKFDSEGKLLTKWGSLGRGDGQFDWPNGIAIDKAGDIYIAEYYNHRIQKFDSNGNFLMKWGSQGRGDGQFNSALDVAIDNSGDFYVADGNNRIQKFDSKGRFLLKWGGPWGDRNGEFKWPLSIAVDGSGDVYVADLDNFRIQKFDSKGRFLLKWGEQGSGDAEFDWLGGITTGRDGNVYVTDYEGYIQKFDSKGRFLTKWGTSGTGDIGLDEEIHGIAVGPSGDIYVADAGNSRIKVYRQVGGGAVEPSNKQMGTWGGIKRTELYQNYPNPFNPETWIPFSLSEPEHVVIRIYNSAGLLTRTLDLGQTLPGAYLSKEKAAYWDGRNEAGETVASDVYFYAMEAGGYKSVKKMILAR